MRQKLFFLLIALLMLKGRACAQNYNRQRSTVLLVNVLGNALVGGVGGAINKAKEEKLYRAFVRNFIKGGLGGLVKYSAKSQTFYLADQRMAVYAPLNRLYYFLGHSVVMNAAYNRKALGEYNCNLFGIAVGWSRGKAPGSRFSARLSLATAISAGMFAAQGYDLNLYRSLEYGVLYFDMGVNPGPYAGFGGFNCMAIMGNGTRTAYEVLPHEIVHTYQAYDQFGFSSFYAKRLETLYKDRKVYRLLSRYMVADYEWAFFSALYATQPEPKYYRNYFEFEAEHFRSRVYLPR